MKDYTTSEINNFTRTAWGNNGVYNSDYVAPVGSRVLMKFSSLPSNFQIGLGEYNTSICIQQAPGSSGKNIFASSNHTFSQTITSDTVICLEVLSETSVRVLFDDTVIGTYTVNDTILKKIKLIKYYNIPYDLDYIKFKPL